MENCGDKMELLRLSKFKLQLRTLVAELRELRERERSATEQLHCRIQKQKQTEEEYARKLHELQAELSSSNELRQKFERKVNYLQNDNTLLENKQKELKETIQKLVQSKEVFVNAYDESTSDLKRSIQVRDRKLSVLSEKLKSHLLLFDSIEKEAFSVKQVVDNAQRVMCKKEDTVADLKSNLEKVSALEEAFVEKISDLEQKLKNDEDQIQRKNEVISELEAQLEAATISTACQTQIDEISKPSHLQKMLSSKDMVIQNLILEKEALHLELANLRIIIKKVQDNFANVNEEDKARFSSILECQEGYNADLTKDYRSTDLIQNITEKSSNEDYGIGAAERTASSLSQKSVGKHLLESDHMDSCVSESASSKPQSAANALRISTNDQNVIERQRQYQFEF